MNTDIYIFGNFGNGYTQYPLGDDKKALFIKSMSLSKSTTQIVIHREGNLMYYSYVRKLAVEQALGFSMLLNGMMVEDIHALFCVFEESIGYLASNGLLIKVDNQGEVVPNSEKLSLNQAEVSEACMYIRSLLDSEGEIMGTLPPIDYSVQRGGIKEFDIEDDLVAIRNFSHKMDYVVVYKDADCNTVNLNSTIATIKRLNNEKQRLQNELMEQKPSSPVSSTSIIVTNEPKPDNHMVWAILTTLFCCVPFGIAAIVHAAKVDGLYNSGDFAGAKSESDKAGKWVKYSLVLGGIYLVIVIILSLL